MLHSTWWWRERLLKSEATHAKDGIGNGKKISNPESRIALHAEGKGHHLGILVGVLTADDQASRMFL